MGIVTIPLVLDLTKGIFVGAEYKNGVLACSPECLAPTYPLDESWWQGNAASENWVAVGGDKVEIENTDGSDLYRYLIYNVSQEVAKPITFRLIVEGEELEESSTGFSIYLRLSDGEQTVGEGQVNFPSGTWMEKQFTVVVNPAVPVMYVYAYIFTRNISGKVTYRIAEVFQEGDESRETGVWTSEISDLADLSNVPISSGSIPLIPIAFYYNDLTNVDDMGSVDYSIEQFKKYDIVVTNPPSQNNSVRKQLVQTSMMAAGVKVFGYVQAGPMPDEELMTFAEIAVGVDDCAAGNYYGVFFDMFGGDYGLSRTFQNELIDYAHSLGLKVFANAWVPASVIDPADGPVSLGIDDWVLLESYFIRAGDKYAGVLEGGFLDPFNKYTQTVELAKPLSVKVCGMAYAFSSTELTDTKDLYDAYVLTVGLGIDSLCYNYSMESTSLDWLLDDYPVPKTGETLISPFVQVAENTYQAETDAGILQFIATDDPVTRGHRTFTIPAKYYLTLPTLPEINAQTHKISYYSSADKVTLQEVQSSNAVLVVTDRYLKTEIVLRN